MADDHRKSVTATLREDGTVYFDVEYPSKPLSVQVLDWSLAGLWFLVFAVVVVTIFA